MSSAKPALRSGWPGRRGEGYVAVQGVLFALILLGPRHAGLPALGLAWVAPLRWVGGGLIVVGLSLALWGSGRLGRALTALPYPKDGAKLLVRGPYAWVRHPIYSGLLLAAVGGACYSQGALSLLWAGLLFVLFDRKAVREEAWLEDRHRGYTGYRRRVRKLIPWVY